MGNLQSVVRMCVCPEISRNDFVGWSLAFGLVWRYKCCPASTDHYPPWLNKGRYVCIRLSITYNYKTIAEETNHLTLLYYILSPSNTNKLTVKEHVRP